MTCVVVLLGVAAYFAYSAYQHTTALLISAGCQAGSGTNAVSLDTQQASIAATIAGVAAAEKLPAHAVTIAYATALQESHLHNLAYGDRDSVGVFQQRPSEGWGTASQLKDPVYATAAFFRALTKVPGWQQLPVDQAAQAVQHSADGSAYSQYDLMARAMAIGFTGQAAHSVYCWPGAGPLRAIPSCNPTDFTCFGRMSLSILLRSPSVSSCRVTGFVRPATKTAERAPFVGDAADHTNALVSPHSSHSGASGASRSRRRRC